MRRDQIKIGEEYAVSRYRSPNDDRYRARVVEAVAIPIGRSWEQRTTPGFRVEYPDGDTIRMGKELPARLFDCPWSEWEEQVRQREENDRTAREHADRVAAHRCAIAARWEAATGQSLHPFERPLLSWEDLAAALDRLADKAGEETP